jgi:Ca2+-binding RTX toxin-like protein
VADAADFPGAAAADLSLTNLAAGVAVAATNFHDDLSISLANATGNADKLDVTVNGFSGALTTTDIETVHLNLVEPADGSATGVDMSAATGVDHLGISAPSGVLTLLMPGDATLDLENCNLYIHLLDNALTSLDVTLDNTGVTLQTDSAGFVLNLDTGGSGAGPDGPSFVSTRPSGAATINVKGSQALDMGVQDQDVDAHTMTGDLHVWAGESTAAVSLIGGQGNDYLQGGSGDDRLNGGGVGSADLLFGNAGADTFVFDHQPTDGNNTYLPDFVSGEDKIELKQSVFHDLATEGDGTLAAGAFFKGDPGDPAAVAGAAGAHILFEPNSGNLYYDGDATAGGEQLFANVWYNNNVEHGDIHVVA